MVTSCCLMPLMISLSGKGRPSALVARVPWQTEAWGGFEARLYLSRLLKLHPLAPKGEWDHSRPGEGLKIKPCAVLCLFTALPVICCVILSNRCGQTHPLAHQLAHTGVRINLVN